MAKVVLKDYTKTKTHRFMNKALSLIIVGTIVYFLYLKF